MGSGVLKIGQIGKTSLASLNNIRWKCKAKIVFFQFEATLRLDLKYNVTVSIMSIVIFEENKNVHSYEFYEKLALRRIGSNNKNAFCEEAEYFSLCRIIIY